MSGNECKAAGLTVEEDLEGFLGNENLLNSSGVVFDLETTEVDTTHATVMVHYRWDGEVVDLPYVCERVGTKWRVALRETEELWFEEPS